MSISATTSERHRYNILVDRLDRLGQIQAGEYRLIILDFRNTAFSSSTAHTTMAMHMAREGITERGGEVHGIGERMLFCLAESKNQDALKTLLQEVLALTPGRSWGASGGGFVTSLGLKTDAARLKEIMKTTGDMVAAHDAEAQKAKTRAETAEIAVSVNGATRPAGPDPFSTARFSPVVQLEFIEEQLPNLRFGELLRSQPICRFDNGEIVDVVAHEVYSSIADLQKRFSTSIDMVAHYLLRHHLTHNLGQLLLNDLQSGRLIGQAGQVFVNLQIATLSSAAFRGFDEAIGDLRQRVVLEFDVTDLLAHIADFRSLAIPLRERGYGIALAGMSLVALEEVEVERLPLSALKLVWQSDAVLGAKAVKRLEVFKANGGMAVLGRADRKTAMTWGAEQGISHFQGLAVDEAAANLFHHSCAVAEARHCTPERCRSVHWAPGRSAAVNCQRPLWTSPAG